MLRWLTLVCLLLIAPARAQETGVIRCEIEGLQVLALVPRDYSDERPWGLVLSLHGTRMKGRHMAEVTPVRELHQAGYLLVCPSSPQGAWGTSGSGGTAEDKTREIQALRAVLEHFLGEYRVDPRCVHTIGFSAGTIVAALAVGYRPEWDGLSIRSVCGHSGGLGGRVQPARPGRAEETAVWILNGSRDGGHARISHNIYEGFQTGGYTARYTGVFGLDHAFPLVDFLTILGWWCQLDGDRLDAGRGTRARWRERYRAWRLLADGEPGLARELYQHLCRERPDDPDLLFQLAVACSSLDEGEQALELMAAAVQKGYRLAGRIQEEPGLAAMRAAPGYPERLRLR